VVIDFETTTPAGRRPEPIDVAAVSLRWAGTGFDEVGRYSALIQPPAHAPVTGFDTEQTGITADMVAAAPPAAEAMAALDATFKPDGPYLLVAHNAPTEAGLLYDHRDHCPLLAATSLIDTLRLARVAFPGLDTHRLDALLHHLHVPRPADRHRALADVEATAQVFARIIDEGIRARIWRSVAALRDDAGYRARAAEPEQGTLFGQPS
jgi:DNA polymerase III epsilon subunit-like protein